MRVGKLAAAVGATACVLGGGSVALAASNPKGGKINIYVTTKSATKDKVLVTGAIGDYGTAISQNAKGKVSPNGAYEKVKLKNGGFIVNATGLNNKINKANPTINKASCSVVLRVTGPAVIGNGTGGYKGISGSLKITLTFAGVANKTAKGCVFNKNGSLHGMYQSITGSGSVKFIK
jgi:hypothetical protein